MGEFCTINLVTIMGSLQLDFRFILLGATLATIIGGLLIPTFQRLFTKSVYQFSIHKSIPR